jgi:hypothetical protein
MTAVPAPIRKRERDAVIQSLRAGVVPRQGQHHVQVGRAGEIRAIADDLDRVADGGSSIRFVIGSYGSGKTFFLHLVRSIGMAKRLVTAHADLTPDRRLQGTQGQARSLYAELMRNLATRSTPEGGALGSVVERFVSSALQEAQQSGVQPTEVLQGRLHALSEMVGGFDFAQVIDAYWRAHDSGNEETKGAALRWLRGEYTTRTDARAALGVRTIVDDANVWDQLKLMARFVRLSDYAGLVVCLDELVNLYKIHHTVSRNANYEQVLRVLNDSLQGTSVGLGVLLGGTPEFLSDTRRGLYSYEALQSRLAENTFARSGLKDFQGPVLRLASLTPEELFVLLQKIRHVYASGEPGRYLVSDDGIHAYMRHCQERIGEAYFRTPRNTITQFVHALSVVEQNIGTSWFDLVGGLDVRPEVEPAMDNPDDVEGGDELASFRL